MLTFDEVDFRIREDWDHPSSTCRKCGHEWFQAHFRGDFTKFPLDRAPANWAFTCSKCGHVHKLFQV